ncbi:MAG: response regulator [Acidobacteriota bacterium]
MTVEQKRVLVVDDDAVVREILSSVLQQHDLTVDAADGGEAAVKLLREHQYAVVLLDLLMPGMDGFGLLDRMAGGDVASPPVVLVITAADRTAIERLDAQRIHGIVRKPFDPEEIARLVVACADIKSRSPFGPMAIATMIAGGPFLALLNRLP